MTVESAGFNRRLPKAIILLPAFMDGYFQVEGGRIKTCQPVEFGVAIVEVCVCVEGRILTVLFINSTSSNSSREPKIVAVSLVDQASP